MPTITFELNYKQYKDACNKEKLAKWVAALRGGKYRQTKGVLHETPDRFCCLGVLCDIHGTGRWVEHKDGGTVKRFVTEVADVVSQPPREVMQSCIGDDQYEDYVVAYMFLVSDEVERQRTCGFSALNDGFSIGGVEVSLTFFEIADVLEALLIQGHQFIEIPVTERVVR